MNRDTAPSRLPADYAREHVRLGYAATEHGYQSDTVDHSLALVSAATTRRGLYVAATRGRDENLLCVVTDSDDVAEARDILDGILAFDRADIPAVTQRRTLAHQQPAEPGDNPAPRHAVTIPEWFEPLLAELRSDLKVAEQAVTDSEAERARLAASAAAARRDFARIETATAPARGQLAAAADGPTIRRGGSTPTPSAASTRPAARRRAARQGTPAAEVRHRARRRTPPTHPAPHPP